MKNCHLDVALASPPQPPSLPFAERSKTLPRVVQETKASVPLLLRPHFYPSKLEHCQ